MAVSPCTSSGAYVTGTLIETTNSDTYSPRCLRVTAGTTVTIEASGTHPLSPRSGGSPGNPIPSTSNNASVAFTTPGFYPFECTVHGDGGMTGVVWVAAP
jgi:plastocyanin